MRRSGGNGAKRLSLRPTSTYVALDSMNLLTKLTDWFARRSVPAHIRLGRLGERAARKYLEQKGLKFLLANYRTPRGEIDLIFRARGDGGAGRIFIRNKSNCLVFVEVKTRSSEDWTRPAAAVDAERRRRLSRTALDYLKLLHQPPVTIRFDIVEVLLTDGRVREVRHLPNAFPLVKPYRYG